MNIRIKSYEEFCNERKKYDGSVSCFAPGCDKPGYYEGGDVRFYCEMCEEHSGINEAYIAYLKNIERNIRTRMMWDKNDPSLEPLLTKVISNLYTAITYARMGEER